MFNYTPVILTQPLENKRLYRKGNSLFRVGAATMQGWRGTMEDTHCISLSLPQHPETGFFAVYDGHGGTVTSEYLSEHFHLEIDNIKNIHNKTTIINTAVSLDNRVMEINTHRDGSTAVFAIIDKHKGQYLVTIGNVGDSRAILIKGGKKAIALTKDHVPTNKRERTRIMKAGGTVIDGRVQGQLAVSRSFGDASFKLPVGYSPEAKMVNSIPDFKVVAVSPSDYLLLTCDGIFEKDQVFSIDSLGNFLSEQFRYTTDLAQICSHLLDATLTRGSYDNMTAVLVQFGDGGNYHRENVEYIPGPYYEGPAHWAFQRAYAMDAKAAGCSLQQARAMFAERFLKKEGENTEGKTEKHAQPQVGVQKNQNDELTLIGNTTTKKLKRQTSQKPVIERRKSESGFLLPSNPRDNKKEVDSGYESDSECNDSSHSESHSASSLDISSSNRDSLKSTIGPSKKKAVENGQSKLQAISKSNDDLLKMKKGHLQDEEDSKSRKKSMKPGDMKVKKHRSDFTGGENSPEIKRDDLDIHPNDIVTFEKPKSVRTRTDITDGSASPTDSFGMTVSPCPTEDKTKKVTLHKKFKNRRKSKFGGSGLSDDHSGEDPVEEQSPRLSKDKTRNQMKLIRSNPPQRSKRDNLRRRKSESEITLAEEAQSPTNCTVAVPHEHTNDQIIKSHSDIHVHSETQNVKKHHKFLQQLWKKVPQLKLKNDGETDTHSPIPSTPPTNSENNPVSPQRTKLEPPSPHTAHHTPNNPPSLSNSPNELSAKRKTTHRRPAEGKPHHCKHIDVITTPLVSPHISEAQSKTESTMTESGVKTSDSGTACGATQDNTNTDCRRERITRGVNLSLAISTSPSPSSASQSPSPVPSPLLSPTHPPLLTPYLSPCANYNTPLQGKKETIVT